MPRRREVPKREIMPDPKHNSALLAKFINVLMHNGKRSVAEKIIYGALEEVSKRAKGKRAVESTSASEDDGEDGRSGSSGKGGKSSSKAGVTAVLDYFEHALDNVRPTVEVRSRRVGGATYQVPVEVRSDRSIALGMRWIVQHARLRSEKGMMLRLAGELADAYDNKGASVKKREDTHRMAKANQAFAHFRW